MNFFTPNGRDPNKKKFNRIIIHAGAWKTGSTYIQRSLHASRDILSEKGAVAYPTCHTGNWHHGELAAAFSSEPEKFNHNIILGIKNRNECKARAIKAIAHTKTWLEQAENCDTIVFSFEGLIELDPKGWLRFKSFCEDYTESVEVLVYAREAMQVAISALSQCIKQGIDTTIEEYFNVVPYRDFLDPLITIFGRNKIHVRLFNKRALVNGNPLSDFLHAAKVDNKAQINDLKTFEFVNKSLSHQGGEIGQKVIAHLKQEDIPYTQSWFFHTIGKKLENIPGRPLELPEAQRTLTMNISNKHTLYLRSVFGLDMATQEAEDPII
jgi:hypothetical protein